LLVAGIDDRHPAREVHQGVGEDVASQQLVVARPRVGVADEHADAAHVVIAQERRQRVDVGVVIDVPVVGGEEVLQLRRGP
jgi:hypothetical protein